MRAMGITKSPTNRSATASDIRKKLVAFCSFLSSHTARMTRMFPPIVGMITITISKAAQFSSSPGFSSGREMLVWRGPTAAWNMVLLQQVLVWVGPLISLVLDTRSAWSLGPKYQDYQDWCLIPCTENRSKRISSWAPILGRTKINASLQTPGGNPKHWVFPKNSLSGSYISQEVDTLVITEST